ncbi:lipocalin family protein [Planktosalinus lacus]|uniref:Lipocalin-like domain-containing protein n=1 Tax=Planktosalinus lacus TaxID=1526573 RepID=A0A8J2VB68_9FLAO|nr:lipocalin family protein [Planktosalinus lacus]GGD99809.1 hypothetical protein GCM10011312_24150 [Planktosalinus lacus]
MKNNNFKTTFLFITALLLWSHAATSQTIDEAMLTGAWELEGNIMGDDGEGWVMPHKHSAPDCGKDHTFFAEDHTAKEVKYTANCAPSENTFTWQLDGDTLTLTKGERSIQWHVLSLKDDTLKVGVQLRPDSDHRLYVVYKKRT